MLTSDSLAEVILTDLVKKIQPAVVTVMTYDKDNNPLGQGSGFFIDTNGLLVTNYHVIEGAYYGIIKTHNGKKYPIKYVVSDNKYTDLIKVIVDIPRSSLRWINVTGELPSIAERVVVVGSPMGLELTVSEGIVSAVRQIPDVGKILQISAPISSGSSGSPVVNMKGKVIGVVSFYLAKGQNLNFAVPSQYLINLKPTRIPKTISEWTQIVDQKATMQRKGRLLVYADPEKARVRILNIKPKFYQGIMLKPGKYLIEVSADGYKMKKIWIKIEPGEDKNLKISLEKVPHSLTKDPQELIVIGFSYAEKKEYQKAIEAFKQAILIDPSFALAHYNLGLAYVALGLHLEAIEAFKQAIRFNPGFAEAYYDLGVSYNTLRFHRKAIEACKQAIRIDPDKADYHYLLGVNYEHLRLDSEAMEAFDKAIWIDLNHVDAHFALGAIYARYNSWREAEEQYNILKTLDKKKADELSNLISTNKD